MIKEAYAINEKNRSTLWLDAIEKEMKDVKITFQTIEGEKPPNGSQYVNFHMMFNIEMKDFQRKALLVAGSHMIHTLGTITYSDVVTRETVCIALTMVVLHGLEVKTADVLNASVLAPNQEKI